MGLVHVVEGSRNNRMILFHVSQVYFDVIHHTFCGKQATNTAMDSNLYFMQTARDGIKTAITICIRQLTMRGRKHVMLRSHKWMLGQQQVANSEEKNRPQRSVVS